MAWENEHVKETTCKDVLLFIDNICNVTSRDLWRYTGPLDFFWAYILGSSASRAYPGHMFSYSSAGCLSSGWACYPHSSGLTYRNRNVAAALFTEIPPVLLAFKQGEATGKSISMLSASEGLRL